MSSKRSFYTPKGTIFFEITRISFLTLNLRY